MREAHSLKEEAPMLAIHTILMWVAVCFEAIGVIRESRHYCEECRPSLRALFDRFWLSWRAPFDRRKMNFVHSNALWGEKAVR